MKPATERRACGRVYPLVGYALALIGAATVVAAIAILIGLAWSGIAGHS